MNARTSEMAGMFCAQEPPPRPSPRARALSFPTGNCPQDCSLGEDAGGFEGDGSL